MLPPPESGEHAGADDGGNVLQKAECLRLLDALPPAAAASPAFRRHWPSISASLTSLSASLSHPAFPPSAPLVLAPLASALSALVSVAGNGAATLGHLHTVSLLSSSAAELSQLAADARLLVSPGNGGGEGEVAGVGVGAGWLIPRLRLGSAASRAAALDALVDSGALPSLIQLVSLGTPRAQELALGCLQNLTSGDGDECQRLKVEAFQDGALGCVKDFLESCVGDEPGLAPAFGLLRNMASFRYIAEIAVSASFVDHVLAALGSDKATTRTEAAMALAELCNVTNHGKTRRDVGDAIPRLIWMLEAKSVTERDAAARALAALVAASGYRKLFKKEEQGIVNVVQLLDPSTARGGVDARFPVSVLLAVSPSRRCRKQMVAAGACGFLQGLLAAEVDGAKKLADCLGRGKMLGVFPRS
uniref:Armadillo repeat-containing domain-containing protein n=1 Tax=Oryza punctata TaxID=4537 RepID=A0A0E0MFS8_ORYPU